MSAGREREYLHQSVQAVTELVRERLICKDAGRHGETV